MENEEEMKIFSKTTATKNPRTFVTSMPKIFNYVLKIIIQFHHFPFPSFTFLLLLSNLWPLLSLITVRYIYKNVCM